MNKIDSYYQQLLGMAQGVHCDIVQYGFVKPLIHRYEKGERSDELLMEMEVLVETYDWLLEKSR